MCVDGDELYTCICTHKFTGLNCNETCLALWTPFNGSSYIFVTFPANWQSAQILCGNYRGSLAEITSAEENAFLVGLRDNATSFDTKERNAWIGLKYQARKRNFVWDSSGKLAQFTNWGNSQQINVTFEGDCVGMLKDGGWTRLFCPYFRPYFCERPDKEFKYCSLEPCRNGGTCTEVGRYYRCSCRPEFIGINCEEFNNCLQNPCLNGATCENRHIGYKCICTPEFTGYHCRKTCPAGWSIFEKRCYTLNISPVNWFSAQSLCRKDGGNLADITSAAENEFLAHLKDKTDVKGTWIGLNDKGNDTYIWVSTGKSANFASWYSGQPKDASPVKECVGMWHDRGAWTKIDCGSSRTYFCERPLFEPCPALDLSERSCYSVGTSLTDWSTAQTSCRKGGGHLVEINSATENAYLVDLMDIHYVVGQAWIGLKTEDSGDSPILVSSRNVSKFTNWDDGRTSDLSSMELCVLMILQSGKWTNARCDSHAMFICEYSSHSSQCLPDPCLNGGTCIGGNDNYTCSCRPNFFGRNCEEFHSCFSNPCKNGGTCVDEGNYYICNCADGFTGGNCRETCPKGWSVFERSCYSFNASTSNWTSAQTSCINLGGNLAQITSALENTFLVELRDQAEVTGTYNAWIGLMTTYETTPTSTPTWILSAGQVAKFTNWAKGQPSGDGGCAVMWWSGEWNDLKCARNQPYFCERSTMDAY